MNANSKSARKAALSGTPQEWAHRLNYWAYQAIKAASFAVANQCAQQFYGIVFVDLPDRTDNDLFPTAISAIVIMSNCGIYNAVTVAKNWGNLAAVLGHLEGGRLARARVIDDDIDDSEYYDDWDEDEDEWIVQGVDGFTEYYYDAYVDDQDEEDVDEQFESEYDELKALYNELQRLKN